MKTKKKRKNPPTKNPSFTTWMRIQKLCPSFIHSATKRKLETAMRSKDFTAQGTQCYFLQVYYHSSPPPLLSYILPLIAMSNFTRSTSESWKSFPWKEAICLRRSTPSRSEMVPSVFSLPRCIASSKYLSIKWQTCRVARGHLSSGKA